ncbi:2-hexyl-5-propylresorcinol biosynthesis acyl carrier protein DarC [Pseudomonas chlororaphis]|uniref:2-hexyl-5-propylresorcinol biosynthesis acyl carrier protein DarC n=1 Tax=Pseudomonas chlororaphis TaxID=587753 RepID=UPI0012D2E2D5|nr:2-hexyl-5-propylresorcinol biosynthesis acyl carrier protein DarC [Pseudomonas chlororaphis]
MTMETLEQRVKRVVASELAVDLAQIGNQDSFVGNLGADSLARVELVTALETEFELTIPDDQADSLQTVQQVIDYLRQATEQAIPA